MSQLTTTRMGPIVFGATLLLLAGGHSAARAQLRGVPVFYAPIHDPGWSFHADYANSLNDLGGVNSWSARVTYAPGFNGTLRLTGAIGMSLMPNAPDDLTLGANAALSLWRRRLTLVDVQAGIGYVERDPAPDVDVNQIDIPLGAAATVNALLPFERLSNVQLWVAPRFHLRRSSGMAAGSNIEEWRGGVGLGIGLELLLPSGFGLNGAIEWLLIRDALDSLWRHEMAFAIGLVLRVLPQP